MNIPKSLILYLENSRFNDKKITRHCLCFIFRGLFYRSHSPVVLTKVIRSNADCGKQMPCTFIELGCVPLHIHVTHMIQLIWVDNSTIGFNHNYSFITIRLRNRLAADAQGIGGCRESVCRIALERDTRRACRGHACRRPNHRTATHSVPRRGAPGSRDLDTCSEGLDCPARARGAPQSMAATGMQRW